MKTSTTTPRARAPTTPQSAIQRPRSSGIQGDQVTPVKPQRKRKATTPADRPGYEVIDLTGDTPPSTAKKPKVRSQRRQDESRLPERRARRWRDHPPQSYLDRLERIMMQRFE